MPTFTGVSAIGWQFLGRAAASERLLLLQIASLPLPPTEKVCYLAVYQSQGFGVPAFPPVFVQGISVWANGVLVDQTVPRSGQVNEAWALWRKSGLAWTFTTRV